MNARLRRARARLDPVGLVPLAVLIGLASTQSFDLNAFGVLSPDIKRSFHLSQAGIDVVASLTGALPIVFAVAIGFLGDRRDRIRLSRWAALLWGVTAVITGLSPVLAVLVVARVVGGIGYLSSETVYPSLLSDFYPSESLGTAVSTYRFGAQGIGLIGAALAGVIASVAGWRPAFVLLALPTFALVACLSLLREPPRRSPTSGAAQPVAHTSISEGFRRVRSIRSLRRTWYSAFLFGAGTVALPTVLNNFFKDVYHLGDTARGGVTVLLGVGGLVGLAIGGRWTIRAMSNRRPEELPRITGILIMSFGALGLLLSVIPSLAAAVVLTGFVTIGAFGYLPAYTTMVALVSPANLRSQAYGWSLLFYALGAIVITPITGSIADSQGQRPSVAVLSIVVALGGAIAMSVSRFVRADVAAAERGEEAIASGMLLSIRGVDAGYGGVQVLFGVDFDVAAGEMVALLGTNGAGKSTLLKAVTGLLDPTGGTIVFDGRDITHADPMAAAKLGIAQVPGGRGIFPTLTVAENLRIAGWLNRKDKRRLDAATQQALAYFPQLADRLDTMAGSLSGGEQQMLSLAQAFIAQPKLLLIDELSLGLAPTVVKQLIEIVKAIHASGTTVVIVEQSVNVALQLAERAIFMEKGQVQFSGPTAELLERPDILRAVFLGGASNGARARAGVGGRATSGDVVLEVRELTFSYGGIKAVDSVDLTLRRGEILGLLGANGAGKTTLFDLISGFYRPASGRVILGGDDVTGWAPHRRASAGLGRSFQDPRMWPALTVTETLAVALHEEAEITGALAAMLAPPQLASSEARLEERVQELIELMGLGAFRDKFVFELATGSRRIVELATIVARRPQVILLDEPSSGIAQRETEALGPLIHRIRAELECSIMIIEHDISLIRAVSERMMAMELGAVIAEGLPDKVLNDPRVVESYLGGPLELTAVASTNGSRPRRRTRTSQPANGSKPVPTTGRRR
jgi:ABC-type branched-subunit amino acid transport system ATPase component/predicted MFS family arabinose efflux permease